MSQTTIHYVSSLPSLKEFEKVLKIALLAHNEATSCEDIKAQLAKLDEDHLRTAWFQITELIKANTNANS